MIAIEPTLRFTRLYIPVPFSGCWLWTGWLNDDGYARFHLTKTKTVFAYKWYYELKHGPIPDGLELDHKCRVRACVNDIHLEPVTHSENVKRGIAGDLMRARRALITHCPQGHPYSGDNLYIYTNANGGKQRFCRTCSNVQHAKRYKH